MATFPARQSVRFNNTLVYAPATAPVMSTFDSAWNVSATITQTSAATWGIAGKTVQTFSSTWQTRVPIVSDATSANIWFVRTPVPITSANTWTVRALVSTTSASTWTACALVVKTVSVTWSFPNPFTSQFIDTFTSGALDSRWSGTGTLSSGRLGLNAASGNSVATSYTYDFTGSYIQAKVDVSGATSAANVHLKLSYDSATSTNFYSILWNNGTLSWLKDNTALATITYDATAHAYWRIREASGTIYWDTSPDGTVWTNRRSSAHSRVLTASKISLESYSGSGFVYFDDLNVLTGKAAAVNAVSWTVRTGMSALSDTFDGPSLDPHWAVTNNTTIESGRAKLNVPSSGPPLANMTTNYFYDLNWSSVSAQITVPSYRPPGFRMYMSLFSKTQSDLSIAPFEMGIETSVNYINFGSEAGAPTPSGVAYDPVSMAYWRLRESAGIYYWDTSPDGVVWTNQANRPVNVVYPEGYQLQLASDGYGAGGYGYTGSYPGHIAYVDNVQGVVWLATETISTSFTVLWNGNQITSSVSSVSWTDRTQLSTVTVVSWTDSNLIGTTTQIAWIADRRIATTSSITWQDNAKVSAASLVTWLTQSISSTAVSSSSSWIVRNTIVNTVPVGWQDLQRISEGQAVGWLVRSRVGQAQGMSWRVLRGLSTASSVSWQNYLMVSTQDSLAWKIAQRLTSTTPQIWIVRKEIYGAYSVIWASHKITIQRRPIGVVTRQSVNGVVTKRSVAGTVTNERLQSEVTI